VTRARCKEMDSLSSIKYLDALCVFFWAATSVLFSVATFGLCVLMGHPLTAANVFPSIFLFNILRHPLNALPCAINGVVEAMSSLRRLQSFLVMPDVQGDWAFGNTACTTSDAANGKIPDAADDSPGAPPPKEERVAAVTFVGASFAHFGNLDDSAAKAEDGRPATSLANINLAFRKGTLTVVLGDVGSGKSSLLAAILGESSMLSGGREVNGTLAYVAQNPNYWIISGSIRDNVLLGAEFEQRRYDEALWACALDHDVDEMGGDSVDVGMHGAKLSGGQRARLALARALYQDRDVYVLDDVLSAVDAHVSQWIVQRAITGPLMSSKTRIVVTKSAQCIAAADAVLRLHKGRLTSVAHCASPAPGKEGGQDGEDGADVGNEHDDSEERTRQRSSARLDCHHAYGGEDGSLLSAAEKDVGVSVTDDKEGDPGDAMTGSVSWAVYLAYLGAAGLGTVAVVAASLALTQTTSNGADVWMARWVDANERLPGSTGTQLSSYFACMFFAWAGASLVFTLFRAFSFARAGLQATRRLHRSLLSNLFTLPASFFDGTPTGRILCRFSTDLARLDFDVPFVANIFVGVLFSLMGMGAVLIYGQPSLVLALASTALFWKRLAPVQSPLDWYQWHRRLCRDVKRLESASLSPVLSSLSECAEGAATIRAFGAQGHFVRRYELLCGAHQRAVHMGTGAQLWMSLRMDLVANALTLLVVLATVAGGNGSASAGFLGLSMTYTVPLIRLLRELVSTFADIEQGMVSVERIVQYAGLKGEEELSPDSRALRPDADSSAAAVRFSDVHLQYGPQGARALRGLSMDVQAGCKVVICGRTGAGKSSVVNALLRLADMQSGSVAVDGVDVCDARLEDLRRCVAVLPQTPFVFEGSLRSNVDPEGRYGDEDVGRALEEVGLARELSAKPRGGGGGAEAAGRDVRNAPGDTNLRDMLNFRLGRGGQGISEGQKQLLCFARLMLARPRVVVFDEHTASVDAATAAKMSDLAERHLADATVIQIAHDLECVRRCDRVFVMADGAVVEQGAPAELLRDAGSRLSGMFKALR
ncbi:unnamed protein product, partial [Ostreobium quekettii]